MTDHTIKYMLEVSHDRDRFEQHARSMHKAILAFRKCKLMFAAKDLRCTEEYANLCDAWKAFDLEISSLSHKDKLVDVMRNEAKPKPNSELLPAEGWHGLEDDER